MGDPETPYEPVPDDPTPEEETPPHHRKPPSSPPDITFVLLAAFLLFGCGGIASAQTVDSSSRPSVQQIRPANGPAPIRGEYLTTCWGSRDSCQAQYPDDELLSPFGGDYEWWIYEPDYPIEY